jgi:hypothetical protein
VAVTCQEDRLVEDSMFTARPGRPVIPKPNWLALRLGGCNIGGGTELAGIPLRIVLLLASPT